MKLSSNLMKSDDLKPKEVTSFFLKEVSQGEMASGMGGFNDPEAEAAKKIGGKLSKIEREAYEKGFASGEEAGRVLGLKKIDPSEKTLLALIEEVKHLKGEILKETEEDILTISLAIARHIIGEALRENPEIVRSQVQKAIKKIGKTERLIIRLHPDDLEMLNQDTNEIMQTQHKDVALRFETNTRLSPGDYIVEGEERMIDGRREKQFKILENQLRTQDK